MPSPLFDDLTDVYEAIVDWPKRLARETPFYRELFAAFGVRSLVDVACGTGHHAALFHEWGLQVEGADISPAMIQRARSAFGEPVGLVWKVRSFHESVHCERPFDAAICIGNSLALSPDHATAKTATQEMLRAVRPGGIVVLQVANLWALPDGPVVWQKGRHLAGTDGEAIVVKGIHRCGSQGFVNLVIVPLAKPAELTSQSVPFLGLTPEQLTDWLSDAGAQSVRCLGSYQDTSYDQAASPDLLVVAQKLDAA